MKAEQLKEMIEQTVPGIVYCQGEDGRHFTAIVISTQFEGLTTVNRQKKVYAALGDKFSSGEIHALSLKTYTPSKWQEINPEGHTPKGFI